MGFCIKNVQEGEIKPHEIYLMNFVALQAINSYQESIRKLTFRIQKANHSIHSFMSRAPLALFLNEKLDTPLFVQH